MTLAVTPLYVGLIVLIFLWLSTRIILYRRFEQVSLGHNGDKALLTRIRGQGNTAKYAPIGLLLLLISELQGAPASALHVLGVLLLAGRALHALTFASHLSTCSTGWRAWA